MKQSYFTINETRTIRDAFVYINNNKLPKPLVQSGWLPEVAIRVRAHRLNRNIATYLNITDLVIHYDDIETPWGKQKICKI